MTEAEDAYMRATTLLQTAVKARPDTLDDVVSLAAALANWGMLRKDNGQAEQSLELYSRAIEYLTPIVEMNQTGMKPVGVGVRRGQGQHRGTMR